MDARQIMNDYAVWWTWYSAAHDCDHATHNATDFDDWLESGVLYEGTLNAWGIMEEAMK